MKYKIIIPKEEPKTKCYCGHTTYCDCGVDVDFEIKQETLEEAAERLFDGFGDITKPVVIKRAIELVKCQQEKMYSEEEVVNILIKAYEDIGKRKIPNQVVLASWFKQFKKK